LALQYREPIKVTVGFVSLYFFFLIGVQSGSKFYLYLTQGNGNGNDGDKHKEKQSYIKIKYGSTDKVAMMGNRTAGNMLEQSVPFLTSLWLHAIFVDTASAAELGWYWIGFRAIYPVVFYKGAPWLFVSTFPGYYYILKLVYPVYKQAFNR